MRTLLLGLVFLLNTNLIAQTYLNEAKFRSYLTENSAQDRMIFLGYQNVDYADPELLRSRIVEMIGNVNSKGLLIVPFAESGLSKVFHKSRADLQSSYGTYVAVIKSSEKEKYHEELKKADIVVELADENFNRRFRDLVEHVFGSSRSEAKRIVYAAEGGALAAETLMSLSPLAKHRLAHKKSISVYGDFDVNPKYPIEGRYGVTELMSVFTNVAKISDAVSYRFSFPVRKSFADDAPLKIVSFRKANPSEEVVQNRIKRISAGEVPVSQNLRTASVWNQEFRVTQWNEKFIIIRQTAGAGTHTDLFQVHISINGKPAVIGASKKSVENGLRVRDIVIPIRSTDLEGKSRVIDVENSPQIKIDLALSRGMLSPNKQKHYLELFLYPRSAPAQINMRYALMNLFQKQKAVAEKALKDRFDDPRLKAEWEYLTKEIERLEILNMQHAGNLLCP